MEKSPSPLNTLEPEAKAEKTSLCCCCPSSSSSPKKRKADTAPPSEKSPKRRKVDYGNGGRFENCGNAYAPLKQGKKLKRDFDFGAQRRIRSRFRDGDARKLPHKKRRVGSDVTSPKGAKETTPVEGKGRDSRVQRGPARNRPDPVKTRKTLRILPRKDVRRTGLLGEGEYGRAYRCRVRTAGDQWRDGVLKVGTQVSGRRGFFDEMKLLHLLQGVKGVPVLYGRTKWPKYGIVMSYNGGHTLESFMRKHFDNPRKLLGVLSEVARILDDIHKAGLGHNDLHYNNVVVDEDKVSEDGHECPTIIDFGYALPFGSTLFEAPLDRWERSHYHPEIARDCERTRPEHDVYSFAKLVADVPRDGASSSKEGRRLRRLLKRVFSLDRKQCPSLGELSEALRAASMSEEKEKEKKEGEEEEEEEEKEEKEKDSTKEQK